MKIKILIICILGVVCVQQMKSQVEFNNYEKYIGELGVMAGAGYYIGENNYTPFVGSELALSAFFRYKLNTRIAFKFDVSRIPIWKANTTYLGDLTAEYNFFDLETNPNKRYSKTFSPYIFAGVSFVNFIYPNQKSPEWGIPIGLGIKVKLTENVSFNAEWCNRLMFCDNLEGDKPDKQTLLNNRGGLNGNNIFNNDMLSNFSVGICIGVVHKHCKCFNTFK